MSAVCAFSACPTVTPDDVVLTFVAPADPISMNEGDDWKVRGKSALWRDRAFWAWVEYMSAQGRWGPTQRAFGAPAVVNIVLPFEKNRRRDPINYAKTTKHVVDGLVLAGAWEDDTLEHVDQRIPTLVVGAGLVVVRVNAQQPDPRG